MAWGLKLRVVLLVLAVPYSLIGMSHAEDQLSKRFVGGYAFVDVPIATAYQDWTTQKGLKGFLVSKADISLQPGGDYSLTMRYRTPESGDQPTNGQILSLQAGEMLSVTWHIPTTFDGVGGQQTFVQLWFESVGPDRTLVTVEQHGFGTGKDWNAAYTYYSDLWRRIFDAYESHHAPDDD
ncbi:MAG: SRPBCC domain-containing protein [Parvularculaceae bacterium]